MGGWWKDTLPAILASAPGHGLSETGLARPGARPASGSRSLGSHAGMKLGGGRSGYQGDVETWEVGVDVGEMLKANNIKLRP